jgi:hypothetical protein
MVLKSYVPSMDPQKMIEEQNFGSSIVDALSIMDI